MKMVNHDVMRNIINNAFCELVLQISELFETKNAMTMIYDEQKMIFQAGPGFENIPEYYRKLFESVSTETGWGGIVAKQKQIVVISDTTSDELWQPFMTATALAGIQSLWIVPVIFAERVFGAFIIPFSHFIKPTKKDTQLLKWLAESATTKICFHEKSLLLQITNTRLTHIQNMVQIGFWKYDFETDECIWSEEVYRIWGIESQQSIIKLDHILQIVHPDDRAIVKNVMHKKRDIQYFEIEFRIHRPDGQERIIQCRHKVIELDGITSFMVGTVQDITNMRETEQNIQAFDLELKSIVQTANDAIFVIDEQDKVVSWNHGAEMMFGYAEEEILGQNIAILLPKDQQEMQLEELRRHFETNKTMEVKRIRKNGSEIPVELAETSWTLNGKIYFTRILRDITERKRAEEDLRRSKNNLKYAQKIAHLGHWDWNLETGEMYWSDEIYRILGYDVNEIDTLDPMILEKCIHPDDQAIVRTSIENVRTGESHDLECRIIRPNGDVRIVHSLGSCEFNEEGKLIYLFGTLQDITVQKQTDDLLRRSEKLFTVGQLAAGLAHEIRNPLTALKGFIQLLRARYKDGVQEYFTIMFNEIGRIEDITSELLVLAKPQINNYRAIDLPNILHSVIVLLETQAIMNNVQIAFAGSQKIPFIRADENQFRQVFVNIIKNAVEAMPNGGILKIQMYLQSDQVAIQFSDNGKGIPEHVLHRLGEPFYTTKDKGTGLGVMVSQKIIADHQGHMTYTSQLGVGTTVTVMLPIESTACNTISNNGCDTYHYEKKWQGIQ